MREFFAGIFGTASGEANRGTREEKKTAIDQMPEERRRQLLELVDQLADRQYEMMLDMGVRTYAEFDGMRRREVGNLDQTMNSAGWRASEELKIYQHVMKMSRQISEGVTGNIAEEAVALYHKKLQALFASGSQRNTREIQGETMPVDTSDDETLRPDHTA